MKARLLRVEKIAILVFILLFLLSFGSAEISRRTWVLGMLGVGIVWLMALMTALAGIVWAFKDHESGLDRLRAAVAIPLAIAAAVVTTPLATWSGGFVYLKFHERELAAAIQAAPSGEAVAIGYIEGIPDGGVAIIHSPRQRPETLPQAEMLRLTGERIRDCRRLRADTYLCGYD